MNWDADDPFGRPPRGPPRHHPASPYTPRENDDEWFVHPDSVAAGPYHYRVHNDESHESHKGSNFELSTDQRACEIRIPGSWPGLCTFSIDHSFKHNLIKSTMKNGFNSQQTFQRPWGFVIRQEDRTEHTGRRSEWWTIKVVLKRHEDPDYSYHTSVLWSAPIAATPAQEIRKFAEWARSRGFETVRDFFY